MPKTYNTAKGVQIDFDAFTTKHEKVRAVGNMNVNARGDLLDSQDRKIQDRSKKVASQYRNQIGNRAVDKPIHNSRKAANKAHDIASEYAAPKEEAKAVVSERVHVQPEPVAEETPAPVQHGGGLASAVAKAREAKQEPLKTPRQEEREKPGVRKF